MGGEGVCLSACWDAIPPPPPGDQAEPPPPDGGTPPGWRTTNTPPPPGKQTAAYGLRAAGTHPPGMHSCYLSVFRIADDPSVVRSLLSLLFRLTVQEKSVLVLLNELCRDVHTQLGDIDQVTVQGLFTL